MVKEFDFESLASEQTEGSTETSSTASTSNSSSSTSSSSSSSSSDSGSKKKEKKSKDKNGKKSNKKCIGLVVGIAVAVVVIVIVIVVVVLVLKNKSKDCSDSTVEDGNFNLKCKGSGKVTKKSLQAAAEDPTVTTLDLSDYNGDIDPTAFDDCENIAYINADSKKYTSENGVLFKKTSKGERKELVRIPPAYEGGVYLGTVVDDGEATNSGSGAIVIGKGIKKIASHALAGLRKINTIRISRDVETIEKGAFGRRINGVDYDRDSVFTLRVEGVNSVWSNLFTLGDPSKGKYASETTLKAVARDAARSLLPKAILDCLVFKPVWDGVRYSDSGASAGSFRLFYESGGDSVPFTTSSDKAASPTIGLGRPVELSIKPLFTFRVRAGDWVPLAASKLEAKGVKLLYNEHDGKTLADLPEDAYELAAPVSSVAFLKLNKEGQYYLRVEGGKPAAEYYIIVDEQGSTPTKAYGVTNFGVTSAGLDKDVTFAFFGYPEAAPVQAADINAAAPVWTALSGTAAPESVTDYRYECALEGAIYRVCKFRIHATTLGRLGVHVGEAYTGMAYDDGYDDDYSFASFKLATFPKVEVTSADDHESVPFLSAQTPLAFKVSGLNAKAKDESVDTIAVTVEGETLTYTYPKGAEGDVSEGEKYTLACNDKGECSLRLTPGKETAFPTRSDARSALVVAGNSETREVREGIVFYIRAPTVVLSESAETTLGPGGKYSFGLAYLWPRERAHVVEVAYSGGSRATVTATYEAGKTGATLEPKEGKFGEVATLSCGSITGESATCTLTLGTADALKDLASLPFAATVRDVQGSAASFSLAVKQEEAPVSGTALAIAWSDSATGSFIVRAGEPSDFFYVRGLKTDGTVAVSIAKERTTHTLTYTLNKKNTEPEAKASAGFGDISMKCLYNIIDDDVRCRFLLGEPELSTVYGRENTLTGAENRITITATNPDKKTATKDIKRFDVIANVNVRAVSDDKARLPFHLQVRNLIAGEGHISLAVAKTAAGTTTRGASETGTLDFTTATTYSATAGDLALACNLARNMLGCTIKAKDGAKPAADDTYQVVLTAYNGELEPAKSNDNSNSNDNSGNDNTESKYVRILDEDGDKKVYASKDLGTLDSLTLDAAKVALSGITFPEAGTGADGEPLAEAEVSVGSATTLRFEVAGLGTTGTREAVDGGEEAYSTVRVRFTVGGAATIYELRATLAGNEVSYGTLATDIPLGIALVCEATQGGAACTLTFAAEVAGLAPFALTVTAPSLLRADSFGGASGVVGATFTLKAPATAPPAFRAPQRFTGTGYEFALSGYDASKDMTVTVGTSTWTLKAGATEATAPQSTGVLASLTVRVSGTTATVTLTHKGEAASGALAISVTNGSTSSGSLLSAVPYADIRAPTVSLAGVEEDAALVWLKPTPAAPSLAFSVANLVQRLTPDADAKAEGDTSATQTRTVRFGTVTVSAAGNNAADAMRATYSLGATTGNGQVAYTGDMDGLFRLACGDYAGDTVACTLTPGPRALGVYTLTVTAANTDFVESCTVVAEATEGAEPETCASTSAGWTRSTSAKTDGTYSAASAPQAQVVVAGPGVFSEADNTVTWLFELLPFSFVATGLVDGESRVEVRVTSPTSTSEKAYFEASYVYSSADATPKVFGPEDGCLRLALPFSVSCGQASGLALGTPAGAQTGATGAARCTLQMDAAREGLDTLRSYTVRVRVVRDSFETDVAEATFDAQRRTTLTLTSPAEQTLPAKANAGALTFTVADPGYTATSGSQTEVRAYLRFATTDTEGELSCLATLVSVGSGTMSTATQTLACTKAADQTAVTGKSYVVPQLKCESFSPSTGHPTISCGLEVSASTRPATYDVALYALAKQVDAENAQDPHQVAAADKAKASADDTRYARKYRARASGLRLTVLTNTVSSNGTTISTSELVSDETFPATSFTAGRDYDYAFSVVRMGATSATDATGTVRVTVRAPSGTEGTTSVSGVTVKAAAETSAQVRRATSAALGAFTVVCTDRATSTATTTACRLELRNTASLAPGEYTLVFEPTPVCTAGNYSCLAQEVRTITVAAASALTTVSVDEASVELALSSATTTYAFPFAVNNAYVKDKDDTSTETTVTALVLKDGVAFRKLSVTHISGVYEGIGEKTSDDTANEILALECEKRTATVKGDNTQNIIRCRLTMYGALASAEYGLRLLTTDGTADTVTTSISLADVCLDKGLAADYVAKKTTTDRVKGLHAEAQATVTLTKPSNNTTFAVASNTKTLSTTDGGDFYFRILGMGVIASETDPNKGKSEVKLSINNKSSTIYIDKETGATDSSSLGTNYTFACDKATTNTEHAGTVDALCWLSIPGGLSEGDVHVRVFPTNGDAATAGSKAQLDETLTVRKGRHVTQDDELFPQDETSTLHFTLHNVAAEIADENDNDFLTTGVEFAVVDLGKMEALDASAHTSDRYCSADKFSAPIDGTATISDTDVVTVTCDSRESETATERECTLTVEFALPVGEYYFRLSTSAATVGELAEAAGYFEVRGASTGTTFEVVREDRANLHVQGTAELPVRIEGTGTFTSGTAPNQTTLTTVTLRVIDEATHRYLAGDSSVSVGATLGDTDNTTQHFGRELKTGAPSEGAAATGTSFPFRLDCGARAAAESGLLRCVVVLTSVPTGKYTLVLEATASEGTASLAQHRTTLNVVETSAEATVSDMPESVVVPEKTTYAFTFTGVGLSDDDSRNAWVFDPETWTVVDPYSTSGTTHTQAGYKCTDELTEKNCFGYVQESLSLEAHDTGIPHDYYYMLVRATKSEDSDEVDGVYEGCVVLEVHALANSGSEVALSPKDSTDIDLDTSRVFTVDVTAAPAGGNIWLGLCYNELVYTASLTNNAGSGRDAEVGVSDFTVRCAAATSSSSGSSGSSARSTISATCEVEMKEAVLHDMTATLIVVAQGVTPTATSTTVVPENAYPVAVNKSELKFSQSRTPLTDISDGIVEPRKAKTFEIKNLTNNADSSVEVTLSGPGLSAQKLVYKNGATSSWTLQGASEAAVKAQKDALAKANVGFDCTRSGTTINCSFELKDKTQLATGASTLDKYGAYNLTVVATNIIVEDVPATEQGAAATTQKLIFTEGYERKATFTSDLPKLTAGPSSDTTKTLGAPGLATLVTFSGFQLESAPSASKPAQYLQLKLTPPKASQVTVEFTGDVGEDEHVLTYKNGETTLDNLKRVGVSNIVCKLTNDTSSSFYGKIYTLVCAVRTLTTAELGNYTLALTLGSNGTGTYATPTSISSSFTLYKPTIEAPATTDEGETEAELKESLVGIKLAGLLKSSDDKYEFKVGTTTFTCWADGRYTTDPDEPSESAARLPASGKDACNRPVPATCTVKCERGVCSVEASVRVPRGNMGVELSVESGDLTATRQLVWPDVAVENATPVEVSLDKRSAAFDLVHVYNGEKGFEATSGVPTGVAVSCGAVVQATKRVTCTVSVPEETKSLTAATTTMTLSFTRTAEDGTTSTGTVTKDITIVDASIPVIEVSTSSITPLSSRFEFTVSAMKDASTNTISVKINSDSSNIPTVTMTAEETSKSSTATTGAIAYTLKCDRVSGSATKSVRCELSAASGTTLAAGAYVITAQNGSDATKSDTETVGVYATHSPATLELTRGGEAKTFTLTGVKSGETLKITGTGVAVSLTLGAVSVNGTNDDASNTAGISLTSCTGVTGVTGTTTCTLSASAGALLNSTGLELALEVKDGDVKQLDETDSRHKIRLTVGPGSTKPIGTGVAYHFDISDYKTENGLVVSLKNAATSDAAVTIGLTSSDTTWPVTKASTSATTFTMTCDKASSSTDSQTNIGCDVWLSSPTSVDSGTMYDITIVSEKKDDSSKPEATYTTETSVLVYKSTYPDYSPKTLEAVARAPLGTHVVKILNMDADNTKSTRDKSRVHVSVSKKDSTASKFLCTYVKYPYAKSIADGWECLGESNDAEALHEIRLSAAADITTETSLALTVALTAGAAAASYPYTVGVSAENAASLADKGEGLLGSAEVEARPGLVVNEPVAIGHGVGMKFVVEGVNLSSNADKIALTAQDAQTGAPENVTLDVDGLDKATANGVRVVCKKTGGEDASATLTCAVLVNSTASPALAVDRMWNLSYIHSTNLAHATEADRSEVNSIRFNREDVIDFIDLPSKATIGRGFKTSFEVTNLDHAEAKSKSVVRLIDSANKDVDNTITCEDKEIEGSSPKVYKWTCIGGNTIKAKLIATPDFTRETGRLHIDIVAEGTTNLSTGLTLEIDATEDGDTSNGRKPDWTKADITPTLTYDNTKMDFDPDTLGEMELSEANTHVVQVLLGVTYANKVELTITGTVQSAGTLTCRETSGTWACATASGVSKVDGISASLAANMSTNTTLDITLQSDGTAHHPADVAVAVTEKTTGIVYVAHPLLRLAKAPVPVLVPNGGSAEIFSIFTNHTTTEQTITISLIRTMTSAGVSSTVDSKTSIVTINSNAIATASVNVSDNTNGVFKITCAYTIDNGTKSDPLHCSVSADTNTTADGDTCYYFTYKVGNGAASKARAVVFLKPTTFVTHGGSAEFFKTTSSTDETTFVEATLYIRDEIETLPASFAANRVRAGAATTNSVTYTPSNGKATGSVFEVVCTNSSSGSSGTFTCSLKAGSGLVPDGKTRYVFRYLTDTAKVPVYLEVYFLEEKKWVSEGGTFTLFSDETDAGASKVLTTVQLMRVDATAQTENNLITATGHATNANEVEYSPNTTGLNHGTAETAVLKLTCTRGGSKMACSLSAGEATTLDGKTSYVVCYLTANGARMCEELIFLVPPLPVAKGGSGVLISALSVNAGETVEAVLLSKIISGVETPHTDTKHAVSVTLGSTISTADPYELTKAFDGANNAGSYFSLMCSTTGSGTSGTLACQVSAEALIVPAATTSYIFGVVQAGVLIYYREVVFFPAAVPVPTAGLEIATGATSSTGGAELFRITRLNSTSTTVTVSNNTTPSAIVYAPSEDGRDATSGSQNFAVTCVYDTGVCTLVKGNSNTDGTSVQFFRYRKLGGAFEYKAVIFMASPLEVDNGSTGNLITGADVSGKSENTELFRVDLLDATTLASTSHVIVKADGTDTNVKYEPNADGKDSATEGQDKFVIACTRSNEATCTIAKGTATEASNTTPLLFMYTILGAGTTYREVIFKEST